MEIELVTRPFISYTNIKFKPDIIGDQCLHEVYDKDFLTNNLEAPINLCICSISLGAHP